MGLSAKGVGGVGGEGVSVPHRRIPPRYDSRLFPQNLFLLHLRGDYQGPMPIRRGVEIISIYSIIKTLFLSLIEDALYYQILIPYPDFFPFLPVCDSRFPQLLFYDRIKVTSAHLIFWPLFGHEAGKNILHIIPLNSLFEFHYRFPRMSGLVQRPMRLDIFFFFCSILI